MDLLTIVMMSMLPSNTKVLHLESTDVCQASCPQCAREVDLTFDKNKKNYLTVEKIKNLLSEKDICNLDKMFMCGNYGDPAASHYTLEIFRYFRKINPDIVLGMNTNGAIQNASWWQTLGKLFHKKQDYVVFSIDGLEDTNHIYRRGVNWSKLIENVKSYINTDALAHWDMLVFDHNKHQVEQCKQLAKELGFYIFRAKASRRHNEHPVDFLSAPSGWRDPQINVGSIVCTALQEKSVYISAKGVIHPCCWLGSPAGADIDNFESIQANWSNNPHPICKSICSTVDNKNSFSNQWQKEIQLN